MNASPRSTGSSVVAFPRLTTGRISATTWSTGVSQSLLENSKIKRFLAQRYSELLDEFQELAAHEHVLVAVERQ